MKLNNIFSAILATQLFQIAIGAKILFFYAAAPLSHRTCVEPLAHKLVERGHNITFVSPVKAVKNNSEFNEFVPVAVEEQYRTIHTGVGDLGFPDRLKDKYANFITEMHTLVNFLGKSCEALFSSPDFRPWMENSHFDIIFLSHAANKCGYALAHKYNASVIVMSANTFLLAEEDMFGFPLESSWLRRFHLSNMFTDMSFADRIVNVINPLRFYFYTTWVFYPKIDKMIQEYFQGDDIPPLEQLERTHTALFFINQHFSEDFARSLPPMVVPVGGMHCTDEHKPLPKEMEDFIEGAGDAGFVFISFGSMVKMSKVPEHIIQLFFKAIENMKIRFLWRWDSEPPKNLPANVLTEKWFPQQDLLAHPKIKGFISHGGLMSLQQSIFHAVPLVVLPIVYDQPFNAFRVQHHGIGIHLELSELTEQKFHDAVVRIVEDKNIKEKMNQVSRRFRDRPLSAVDTAVYWTEYAIRHKDDMTHLKPLGIYQTWWERRHLDVWAFVLLAIVFIIAVLIGVLKGFSKAVMHFSGTSKEKPKSQ